MPHPALGQVAIDEAGLHFETGVPVRFPFLHNTESSPWFGERYQQHLEPAGYYVVLDTAGSGAGVSGWVDGMAAVRQPLVVLHNTATDIAYDANSWKARLWQAFGTGVVPSSQEEAREHAEVLRQRILAAGYDAVVTVRPGARPGDPPETSEIVLLDPGRQIVGSGVVDGEPYDAVLYHGTYRIPGYGEERRSFPYNRQLTSPANLGVWFSEDRSVAEAFARWSAQRFAGGVPLVYRVRVQLQKARVFATYNDYLEVWRGTRSAPSMRRSLAQRGYDGVVILRSTTDNLPERVDVCVLQPQRSVQILDIEAISPGTTGTTGSAQYEQLRQYLDAPPRRLVPSVPEAVPLHANSRTSVDWAAIPTRLRFTALAAAFEWAQPVFEYAAACGTSDLGDVVREQLGHYIQVLALAGKGQRFHGGRLGTLERARGALRTSLQAVVGNRRPGCANACEMAGALIAALADTDLDQAKPGASHRVVWAIAWVHDAMMTGVGTHSTPSNRTYGQLSAFINGRLAFRMPARSASVSGRTTAGPSPSVATLDELLQRTRQTPRIQRAFTKWLRDLIDDEADFAEAVADAALYREYFEDWLRDEQGISVREDGILDVWCLSAGFAPTLTREMRVLLYHHTSSVFVSAILKDGLSGTIAFKESQGRRGLVYLTTEYSGRAVQGYGRRAAARHGGSPVTLGLWMYPEDLEPDPDDEDLSCGKYQFVVDFVPPERIVEVDGEPVAGTTGGRGLCRTVGYIPDRYDSIADMLAQSDIAFSREGRADFAEIANTLLVPGRDYEALRRQLGDQLLYPVARKEFDNAVSRHALGYVDMHPALFLALTDPSPEISRQHAAQAAPIQRYAGEWRGGVGPLLIVDLDTGEVRGHEGRHRAAAVYQSGGRWYRVAILPRWSGNRDGWKLTLADLPRTLRNQWDRDTRFRPDRPLRTVNIGLAEIAGLVRRVPFEQSFIRDGLLFQTGNPVSFDFDGAHYDFARPLVIEKGPVGRQSLLAVQGKNTFSYGFRQALERGDTEDSIRELLRDFLTQGTYDGVVSFVRERGGEWPGKLARSWQDWDGTIVAVADWRQVAGGQR